MIIGFINLSQKSDITKTGYRKYPRLFRCLRAVPVPVQVLFMKMDGRTDGQNLL